MATIDERADKIFCDKDGCVLDIAHDYMRIGYIKGAEEQKRIDFCKALKVYEELMTCSGYFPETITAELARMRKKLED